MVKSTDLRVTPGIFGDGLEEHGEGWPTFSEVLALVRGIPGHLETPRALLRSASALWVTNILVLALWYWKLDAGGPLGRSLRAP